MNAEQIINAVSTLANSQGFYGRLLERLTDGTESAKQCLDAMVAQNFSDVVDMVMWLES